MLLTKTVVSLAVLASTAVASINWTSTATLKCAKSNWATIKIRADPLIPSAPSLLTATQLSSLSSLLSGKTTVSANPTDAWLIKLPGALPPSILDMIAGDLITICLAA
ncbi:hypothetical protein FBU59_001963 [Linderina macrospora]|uniref:Uncharacterized protein n=1 Tax=Linderina macrospora TaxID=4868 RepID=A0ACC1JCK1_9FUNG|nr:hypothetical protein FBU59_001963 [Linderina macrospora]